MEFKAEVPDLELQLVTLEGEEVTLLPKISISGTNVIKLVKEWSKLESTVGKDGNTGIDIMAKELAIIYDKEVDWWLDNFDVGTLGQILTYVGESIGTIKKKKKN